jgi:hypothetical protein
MRPPALANESEATAWKTWFYAANMAGAEALLAREAGEQTDAGI